VYLHHPCCIFPSLEQRRISHNFLVPNAKERKRAQIWPPKEKKVINLGTEIRPTVKILFPNSYELFKFHHYLAIIWDFDGIWPFSLVGEMQLSICDLSQGAQNFYLRQRKIREISAGQERDKGLCVQMNLSLNYDPYIY
jgi:hypothetical protein